VGEILIRVSATVPIPLRRAWWGSLAFHDEMILCRGAAGSQRQNATSVNHAEQSLTFVRRAIGDSGELIPDGSQGPPFTMVRNTERLTV
jgi:hypothetical protein